GSISVGTIAEIARPRRGVHLLAREGHEDRLSGSEAHRAWIRRAAVWKSLRRRSSFPSLQTNTHDVATRTRFADRWSGRCGADPGQRPALALVCLLTLAAIFAGTGCNHPKQFFPEQSYRDLWLQLERGETVAALAGANAALQAIPSPDSERYWRFTVLKAEILQQQRLNNEALALLQPELPASLASSDVAVWRKTTQGAASSFQQRFTDAGRFFDEAEALARSNHSELLGSIALRKGTLSFLRGEFLAAQSEYRSALLIARQQKDQSLEAASLGSLGLVSVRIGHYDESIDRYREALTLSQSVGAQGSATRIQGNMGFSYFVMGDFERALALYQQAEQASQQSGLAGDQLHWLINIGNADYELHNYAAAEKIWAQALEL